MVSKIILLLSLSSYATSFLNHHVLTLHANTQRSVVPPDKYLQGLEGTKRSRYSRSWKQKFTPPKTQPLTTTAVKKATKPRPPPTSETGLFCLETSKVNFSSIGGYSDIKEELLQTIDFLKYPGNYTIYNVRLPRGVILCGLPGTGKTL